MAVASAGARRNGPAAVQLRRRGGRAQVALPAKLVPVFLQAEAARKTAEATRKAAEAKATAQPAPRVQKPGTAPALRR